MKKITYLIGAFLCLLIAASCSSDGGNDGTKHADKDATVIAMQENSIIKSGYSDVNGIKMYYEIHGTGKPFVLIHGGGSTIETNFGEIIPLLAKKHMVIAMELQAHGRTADRDKPLSFEQDADDVATLLKHLKVDKADVLGFSNGGQTALELAMRHPALINKLIIAASFYSPKGVFPGFWDMFKNTKLSDMPLQLREGFLKVNNDTAALLKMFNRDVERMRNFKDWTDQQISSIKALTLVMAGTKDVTTIEHALEMHRLLPNSELVILPGIHGQFLGESTTLSKGKWEHTYPVEIIDEFLETGDNPK